MKNLTFPCMNPVLIPIEKVVANDYNPNSVAKPEMNLLTISIEEDGLTMAIVVFYDDTQDKYIIVDGFHRYTIVKDYFKSDVIPATIIDKDIGQRIASTIRHNRARGVHKVMGMSDIVAILIKNGWDDIRIANELGMSPEELLRLKQTKGIAITLANKEYGRSWITK